MTEVRAVAEPAVAARAVKPSRMHLPELDGVRGFAILMVLALHFFCTQIEAPHGKLESVIARFTGYGRWGVDLFFVLSGFLITGILSDTRGSRRYFRTFYMRRTLRIFPLYYATLLIIVLLLPQSLLLRFAPDALRVRELQGWLWTYMANVYIAKSGAFDIPYVSHFWTLAIEEHFYLIWPFAVGLLERRWALGLSLLLSGVAVGSRIAINVAGLPEFYAHVLTPCRLDALCIGACLALGLRGPAGAAALGPFARRAVGPAGLAVVLLSVWHAKSPGHPLTEPLRELFLALFFGLAIVLAATDYGPARYRAWLRTGWLGWLGKYSYGLYVFHGIIAYAFASRKGIDYFEQVVGSRVVGLVLMAGVGFALSVAMAVLSYQYFETPFLKLKKFFEPHVSASSTRS